MKGKIAIGFTSNYINKTTIEFLNNIIKQGYNITFFHPLRVIDRIYKGKGVFSTENEIMKNLLEGNVLKRDSRELIRRFEILLSNLATNDVVIRLVMHTEYRLPLWCNNLFRQAYYDAITRIIENIEDRFSRNSPRIKLTLELHPGFTRIGSCTSSGYYFRCDDIDRNTEKLVNCLKTFKNMLASYKIDFCIEPRAGSIIIGKRSVLPQTLNTHDAALYVAKKTGFKIVIDPGQTILKRVDINEAWMEVERIAQQYPEMIGEVHVHSPRAMRGRGHGLPTLEELMMYGKIIKYIIGSQEDILGVVYEVINTSYINIIENIKVLINIINNQIKI